MDQFRDADGRIYFYDIGATRHPSFAVNGFLVHNSSLLKAYMGATKQKLVARCARIPYRLCCTATPAPNDHMEIGNHAEFLGIMPSSEVLMRFFINDTMRVGTYRLKEHARADFYTWITSWAVAVRRPSDLGYPDEGFALPPLDLVRVVVEVDQSEDAGEALFRLPTLNATTIHREMRLTAPARADAVASLVNGNDDAWAVWCNTNYEADALMARIPGAVEVRGSEPPADKERKLHAFSSGQARVIVTKPSIAGYGLNWQHCHRTAFVGLSYSFEDLYQALRRLYRFGQTKPVGAYVVMAHTEAGVWSIIQEKMLAHATMFDAMARRRPLSRDDDLQLADYDPRTPMIIPEWLRSIAS